MQPQSVTRLGGSVQLLARPKPGWSKSLAWTIAAIVGAGQVFAADPMVTSGSAPHEFDKAISRPSSERPIKEATRDFLLDRIYGGWVGMLIGGLEGLPHEFKYKEQPRETLPEFTFLEHGARSDDDNDFEWTHLWFMDQEGVQKLPYPRLVEIWKANMNEGIWVANKRARELMDQGIVPPETGSPALNPHASYNLSGQFCVEAYGMIAPGMPRIAADLGLHYARLAVSGEPLQAAQYWTSLVSLMAFQEGPVDAAIDAAFAAVDPDSAMAEAVADARHLHWQHRGDWKAARLAIHTKWVQQKKWNMNSTPANGVLVLLALLYGEGDFYKTLQYAMALGYDADCNAATAGAVLGTRLGFRHLAALPQFKMPDRYVNKTRPSLPAECRVSEQAATLMRVCERVILANGGERVDLNGQPGYRVRLQTPRMVEALRATSPNPPVPDPAEAPSLASPASPIPAWFPQAPPLPPARGEILHVKTVEELLAATERVGPGGTILLADGHYTLPRVIVLEGKRDIVLRSASGDPARVTLSGRGWENASEGDDLIHIGHCEGVTIAHLTFADCRSYGVKVEAEKAPKDVHIYDCRFRDIGVRAIKGSAGQDPSIRAVRGSVRYCRFENTTVPPAEWLFGGDYIAAIDMMALEDWTFSNNLFRNIRGRNGGGRAAIFLWVRSRRVVVERNVILNCDRGVAFGNPGQSTANRAGERLVYVEDGIIRNNFIAGGPDCGIELWYADGIKVLHNTIWRPEQNWRRGIRVGSGTAHTELAYNLVHGEILFEGGEAQLRHNLTGRLDGYFVDPMSGNLALTPEATRAIDKGVPESEVTEDISGRPRVGRPDLGAWELRSGL